MSNQLGELKKVDFFWISPDYKQFEWFLNLLSLLEVEQKQDGCTDKHCHVDRFLDFHLYFTKAVQKSDFRSGLLAVAMDLLHEKVTIHMNNVLRYVIN